MIFLLKIFGRTKKIRTFAVAFAEIAQLVEHDLAKVGVAGSSPVFRSKNKEGEILSDFAFLISKIKFIPKAQVVKLVYTLL